MTYLFKKPKAPEIRYVAPPEVTPPSKIMSPIVSNQSKKTPGKKAETVKKDIEIKQEQVKRVEEEKEKLKKKKRRGTLLTGPRGLLEEPLVGKKTLLGQ